MKKITVTIDEHGNTQIETSGFKGKACKDATAELERLLGKTTDKKLKPEYFQKVKGTINVQRN